MGIKQKAWIALAAIATLGGALLIGNGVTYLVSYLLDTDSNPVRHEYLIGLTLSVYLSVPCWLAASAFIFPVRKLIPRWLFISINSVTCITTGLFIIANLLPLLMYSLGIK